MLTETEIEIIKSSPRGFSSELRSKLIAAFPLAKSIGEARFLLINNHLNGSPPKCINSECINKAKYYSGKYMETCSYACKQKLLKDKYNEKFSLLKIKFPWILCLSEGQYCQDNNIEVQPKCKLCNELPSWRSYSSGYHSWCSNKCSVVDDNNIAARWESFKRNNNCNSISSIPGVNEKRKQVMLDRYGHNSVYRFVKNTSSHELYLKEYIELLGFEIHQTCHGVIPNYEVDLWIPEKKLAIEVNGIYWHTEKYKPNDLHANKTKAANEAGIRLLQFTDQEIVGKPNIVESMITNLLIPTKRLYARDMTTVILTYEESSEFLDRTHIQGSRMASVYLGLKDNKGNLVAVMCLNKPVANTKYTGWDICRYSSLNVTGGFTKLLSYFKRLYPEVLEVYSILDLKYGDPNNNIYTKTGFSVLSNIPPDYSYVYKGKEIHKFNFRKKRLISMGADSSLSEHEMAQSLGIYRLYDCGKIKYRKMI